MEMEPRVGLSPEEMIANFNRMYQDSWERSREQIDWQAIKRPNADLSKWVLEVLEIVMASSRDAMTFTLVENNKRIAEQMVEQGLPVHMEEVQDDGSSELDFDRLA